MEKNTTSCWPIDEVHVLKCFVQIRNYLLLFTVTDSLGLHSDKCQLQFSFVLSYF